MQIKRNILLNPGPATTTNTVKMAQVVPDLCPREKEFTLVLRQLCEGLVKVVHGNLDRYVCVLFCGSGTMAMDMCINSLLPDGKKILIINNGTYSMRAVEICEYYSLPFVNFQCPIDELPDLDKVEQILKESQDIALVYTTHNATPILCKSFEFRADIIVHSISKYMDGHAVQIGGAIVDSGKFDWTNGRFPDLTEPDESCHGISYTETYGEKAYYSGG